MRFGYPWPEVLCVKRGSKFPKEYFEPVSNSGPFLQRIVTAAHVLLTTAQPSCWWQWVLNFICSMWPSFQALLPYRIHILPNYYACLVLNKYQECGDWNFADSGNVKNSAKKFTAVKLLRRKDIFYKNLLAIVKSYHRVCTQIFKVIYYKSVSLATVSL